MYTRGMDRLAHRLPSPGVEHTWRRRLLHLSASVIVAGLALGLEYRTAVYIVGGVTAAMLAGEALRLVVPSANRFALTWIGAFMKPREARQPTAATFHLLGSLIVLVLFGPPVAALAVLFLGLGDPAAGIVGERYGRLRLPVFGGRLGGKSLEGTLAFFAVSLAAAAVLWAGGVYSVFWPAMVGAAAAALVEFTPIPLEDNLTVPLAGAVVMWLLWAA